ncbi:hypothetical protein DXA20_06620 [Roseburia sp. AM59-24XD]|nr:hypothetical protein DXA20_06620 [Roseburia sp. AM59-24XD]
MVKIWCEWHAAPLKIKLMGFPPRGEYGRMRLSKIKAAKQLDFSKSVSDKTIFQSQLTDFPVLWQAKCH